MCLHKVRVLSRYTPRYLTSLPKCTNEPFKYVVKCSDENKNFKYIF